ncbi:hypothetical protein Ndes2437B_g03829 [Nannochloris sp. 'desiccata']
MKVNCSSFPRAATLPVPRHGRSMLHIRRAIGDGVPQINTAVVDDTLSVADEVAQKIAESGIDLSQSGLASISDEAKLRALAKKSQQI